jgi:hypothetical protein|tara:strand:+ start:578 stop:802 length:225 start_codon:yes stop_codon:yes gene_type:complete
LSEITDGTEWGDMDKLVPQCKPLKKEYDQCMEKWKKEGIRVIYDASQHPCDNDYQNYSSCVKLGMMARGRKGGS